MKYISFFAVILFGLTFSLSALADNRGMMGGPFFGPGPREMNEEMREKMQEMRQTFHEQLRADREEFLAELKAKKEAWRTANTERKMMFCGAARNMIGRRFEVAVRNLERFQSRMEELIAKLNGEGKNTDAAEESLDQSKDKLGEAKEKIADIRDLIPENCQSVTPEIWEQIKLGAREAKDLLKESHRNLIDALRELKSLRAEGEENEEN